MAIRKKTITATATATTTPMVIDRPSDGWALESAVTSPCAMGGQRSADPYHRSVRRRLLLLVVVVLWGAACGDDAGPGEARADQVRQAAAAAGLDDEVADFLALAARGATATYEATFPGPDEGTTLVVANRPPDRRVDVLRGDDVTEVRLVLDGEALECRPDEESGRIETCDRTDALVEPPGMFDTVTLDRLTTALGERRDDFEFRIERRDVAGVEATCLVTERRPGRRAAELGERGEICVSAEGALLRVEQDGETLEATTYSTDIPEGTFERPGAPPSD